MITASVLSMILEVIKSRNLKGSVQLQAINIIFNIIFYQNGISSSTLYQQSHRNMCFTASLIIIYIPLGNRSTLKYLIGKYQTVQGMLNYSSFLVNTYTTLKYRAQKADITLLSFFFPPKLFYSHAQNAIRITDLNIQYTGIPEYSSNYKHRQYRHLEHR